MKFNTFALAAGVALAALACSDDPSEPMVEPDDDGDDDDDDASDGVCGLEEDEDGALLLEVAEENNYAFTSTLSIDVVPVNPWINAPPGGDPGQAVLSG